MSGNSGTANVFPVAASYGMMTQRRMGELA